MTNKYKHFFALLDADDNETYLEEADEGEAALHYNVKAFLRLAKAVNHLLKVDIASTDALFLQCNSNY